MRDQAARYSSVTPRVPAAGVVGAVVTLMGLLAYPAMLRASWVWSELEAVRNIRPGFAKFGFWGGMINAALETYVFRGKSPWTLAHHDDHSVLKKASEAPKIDYPKPDGVLSFDRLSSVFLSNTNHEEDQPIHLQLKNPELQRTSELDIFAGPSQRYCPAGVYEWVQKDGKDVFVINAQNCVHCKTCDIKDPNQNITWVPPQGGEGPVYPSM